MGSAGANQQDEESNEPAGRDTRARAISPLMTATQVARRMRRTRSAVYDRVYRGEMPGVLHIGRSVYFRKAEILPWLEEWERSHPDEFGGA